MTDCANVDIRDVLPEFLHGTLDRSAFERVQAHLGTCAECTDELQLLRTVYAMSTPATASRVDTARIVAAIQPYKRRGFRFASVTQQMALAATFLICVAGVSTIAVTHYHGANQNVMSSHGIAAATPGISIVGVSDLSDDHLEQLIGEMDQLEAAPPVDPEPVVQGDAEGGA